MKPMIFDTARTPLAFFLNGQLNLACSEQYQRGLSGGEPLKMFKKEGPKSVPRRATKYKIGQRRSPVLTGSVNAHITRQPTSPPSI